MRDVERMAHQNGYHDGREAGEKDARRGRSFSIGRVVTMIGATPTKVIAVSTAIASSTDTSSAKDTGPDTRTATTQWRALIAGNHERASVESCGLVGVAGAIARHSGSSSI
jgi:hypothetical protein